MSPEKLFLRYAFPCTEVRATRNEITLEQVEELGRIVKLDNLGRKYRKILFECFPDAYRAMRELAELSGRHIWSKENVRDYWHNHHRGVSPVSLCRVHSYNPTNYTCQVEMEFGKKAMLENMINMYILPLRVGSMVYVHQRCVIEKVWTT